MRLVNGSLPFSIKPPARCRLVLSYDVPNFNGTDSIAPNQWECREQIDTEELEPKEAYRVFGIRITTGLLGCRVNGYLYDGSAAGIYT